MFKEYDYITEGCCCLTNCSADDFEWSLSSVPLKHSLKIFKYF